ncbi:MAG: hypothetical protein HZA93_28965 [Verrucomicrobia bacterium]|nr:hypothetical protein [Verrucomicrobiota bacterium]
MADVFQRAEAYAKARNLTFTQERRHWNSRNRARRQKQRESPPLRGEAAPRRAGLRREKSAYLRLREIGLVEVRGFNVPQLLRCDDEYRVIEMTIVARPFVLDFAATWLDEPPDFPQDEWQESLEKREQFGERWPEVQQVLAVLRSHGLFMFDLSPTNIAFHR